MVTARLIPTATEDEWLAARRTGITASEIAIVMGLSPYSSPFALYHQKLGTLGGQPDDLAMAIGRHLEGFTSAQFCVRRPEFHVDGDGRQLFAHPARFWQLATPDRVVWEHECSDCGQPGCPYSSEPLAVLECKTDEGFDGWGDDGTDEIPVHYRCQVLWQMDVLGVTTGYVACLFVSRRQFRVYELTMDDQAKADLKLMREEALLFLARLAQRQEPDVDWRPATADALKQLHPAVDDTEVVIPWGLTKCYRAACRDVKAAERRRDLYANRIRQRLGRARRAVHRGQSVARRDVYDQKRVSAELVRAQFPPGVVAQLTKTSTVDKLVPTPAKETTK